MKKIIVSMLVILMLASLAGCNKDKSSEDNSTDIITPTTQPLVTLPAEVTPGEDEIDNSDSEDLLTVEAYFPLEADTEYIYEGEGNEYAAYHRFTDYIDSDNKKVQTRTNNGGTETAHVLQIKDGKLSVINSVNEYYYRENFLEKTESDETEVLLMEPIVQGTEWKLADGRRRFISQTKAPISTPYGNFEALEVTTESDDSTTKDYYAIGVGLVKSLFQSNEMEVSSTLSEVNKDTAYTQVISLYHPDADEKIYVEPITLTFHTGDDTLTVLTKALKMQASKETYLPLISTDTMINSLRLSEDGVVHVDFSKEFVSDMNAGAGYELLILQSVTNTLGNYYGVSNVYITIEGKPYESGHVLMKEGETFKVDMEAVVQ